MAFLIAAIGLLLAGLIVSYARAKANKTQAPFFDPGQGQFKRNPRILWVLIAAGIAYSTLYHFVHALTRFPMPEGGIGVAFGLYICAYPAANAVNLLFFERYRLSQLSSDWPLLRWLALNLLTLFTGWMVIYVGLIRLVVDTA